MRFHTDLARWLNITILALLAAACAETPLGVAQTPDEVVWATYSVARIVVEAAAVLVGDPATPPTVAQAVRSALVAVEPYFVALHDADLAVDAARAALAAGTGTEEKLQIALELLSAAEANAAQPLNAVSAALGGAQ